jgi:RNA polymerase sigma-70 factor, ECF subfamily
MLARASAPSLYCYSSQSIVDTCCFDEEYVRRLTDGDAATEAHFTAYFGNLLTLKLRNKVRSTHGIDDIRQETFLRVLQTLRRRHGLEHPERLGAFVNSVCNNVLLENFRAQSRYVPLPEDHREPVDAATDLERDLVSEERKRMVTIVLDQLSEMDRRILKMLFFDEADKQEICRVMGVSREYLRVLVHRARLRFRAALEKVEAAIP